MHRSGIRIIPRVEDPITQLVRLGVDRDWHLKAALGRDVASGTNGEIAFFVPDEETIIYLLDDLFVGFQYFIIVGPAQERVADGIRKEFHHWKSTELFAWWDRGVSSGDVDDQVDAVLFLGVGSPETPHDDYASRIRSALANEDKDVRNAAVVAAAYTDWRIFRPDLEHVAQADPDSKARERATFALTAMNRNDGVKR